MIKWASILGILLTSCAGIQKSALNERLQDLENRFDHHAAFVLFDLSKDEIIYSYNGDKYFTPASNTKILTFYTCLQILQDSTVAFKYKEVGDSLLLWPMGDPTFLNSKFPHSDVYAFLKGTEKDIYISFSHNNIASFGPGWAWDDYPYTFSVERSALPLYGNYLTIISDSAGITLSTPYFKPFFFLGDSTQRTKFSRLFNSNSFIYNPGRSGTEKATDIPFKTSPWLSARLLSDTLKKPVYFFYEFPDSTTAEIKSLPLDTAYKKMMQESNNFVAEQLLLQSAAVKLGTLSTEAIIKFSLHNLLNFLPQAPVWVDGSGLSRYNLITPQALVVLWTKIYQEYGGDRIFPLLATGGKYGTLKNYYQADIPYIFGKTGTLSNNHNLSGFLITRKGKIFIFSFMNNSYPTSSSRIKEQMEEILWEVHLNN